MRNDPSSLAGTETSSGPTPRAMYLPWRIERARMMSFIVVVFPDALTPPIPTTLREYVEEASPTRVTSAGVLPEARTLSEA